MAFWFSRGGSPWQRARVLTITQPLRGFWSLVRHRHAGEALVIATVCLLTILLADRTRSWADLGEALLRHHAWGLEQALLCLLIVSLGILAFALRRLRETQREIIQRETAELIARGMAAQDALTGLPNRRALNRDIALMLDRANGGGGPAALLIVDLDRFKPVNDLHGHLAGDRLLQAVAGRLRDALGEAGTVFRLGGDEFAVLAPLGGAHGTEEVARLAHRLVVALEAPFDLGMALVQLGCSIGVAIAPHDAQDAEGFMRRADLALYRAKDDGRNCFRFFEPAMDIKLREKASLEAALRLAIMRDEIEPYFQPLVSIENEAVLGFEMLARWRLPLRGLVPPAEFILVAEETGLIVPLTEQLVRRACRVAVTWPDPLYLAVNISTRQLRDRALPAVLRKVLQETGLPPRRLEVELTEAAILTNPIQARAMIEALKEIGVRIALDDFGTGYSSLANLQSMPFDKVKIDRSLVRGMGSDPGSRQIVTAVLGLGQSLGLPVVAEGVEGRGEAVRLREMGCEIAQGWLFGRPMAAEAVQAMLARRSAAAIAG